MIKNKKHNNMKRTLLFLAAAAISSLAMAQQVPAFPGAEGHGRYGTSGGRGGFVYHVTNLTDDQSTKGSLRWCLAQPGPRTIVFDVSGYIDLTKQLNIPANTTIAGQTAPGDGITLRYYTLYLNGDNTIVRFIRVRRGQEKDVNDGADASWGRHHHYNIFDHCSFSWSIDETASFYDNQNFTMQWCTVGEGLNNAGHDKGAHGYGGIWGGKEASFHHNLIIHENNRAPRINGARYWWTGYNFADNRYDNPVDAERVDFRNCVIYNTGAGNGAYGGPGGGSINIVNNYYKAGPATKNKKRVFEISAHKVSDSNKIPSGFFSRFYINGNYVTAAESKAANYDWKGVDIDAGAKKIVDGQFMIVDTMYHFYKAGDYVPFDLGEPTTTGDVTTHSAENAYTQVLNYVGASLVRDGVDARYIEETQTGTATYKGSITNRPGIIDVVADVNGYPDLESASRPEGYDTDQDGMPDEWEIANGLNPNDPSDAQTYTIDTEKGWYTNLEVYLNSIVENIIKSENQNADETVNEYYPTCATKIQGQSLTHDAPIDTKYYASNGQQINPQNAKGVFIRIETFANGKKLVSKVIK